MKNIIATLALAITVFMLISAAITPADTQLRIAYFDEEAILETKLYKTSEKASKEAYEKKKVELKEIRSNMLDAKAKQINKIQKNAALKDGDSMKWSPFLEELHNNELENIDKAIDEFDSMMPITLERTKLAFKADIDDTVNEVIKKVSEQEGYDYVINKQAIYVGPAEDDITQLVTAKFGQ